MCGLFTILGNLSCPPMHLAKLSGLNLHAETLPTILPHVNIHNSGNIHKSVTYRCHWIGGAIAFVHFSHVYGRSSFMQDQIIVSHTCFDGPMDVNCYCLLSQFTIFTVSYDLKKDYKHTCDTIYTHFQGITNNIYGFVRNCFVPSFFTHQPIFLPVHNGFYPSKPQVDVFLQKAMWRTNEWRK